MSEILLGFEIGTAKPVHIPFAHTVVCGQTQASGKTTTLEALLSRAGGSIPALAFLTKEAESAFTDARRIPPYFSDRGDWQFVESILEAMMRERMKYERQWIIRVCQGATSLEQVAKNVHLALYGDGRRHKAATGFAAGMYLQLSEYFKLLMPELRRLKLDMSKHGSKLQLEAGLNVMDLSEYSTEMQSLSIASAMEAVYRMRGVITVIPEAWEFLPQGRNTPVKLAGVSLVRKGAAAKNFMWLDSQDITGVEKSVLKQVGVWILGVQREINEVEKTISQMPVARIAKPKPEEVMHLRRGEFFVSFGDTLKRVYVLPKWMPEEIGKDVAKLERGSGFYDAEIRTAVTRFQPEHKVKADTNMDYKAAYEQAQETITALEKRLSELERNPRRDIAPPVSTVRTALPAPSSVPARGSETQDEVTLNLEVKRPDLNVTIRRYTIEMNDETLIGQLAMLIYEGFFDSAKKTEHINEEFRARGWAAQTGRPSPKNLDLAKLAEYGFIRIVGQGSYQAIEGMKVNVKEVRMSA